MKAIKYILFICYILLVLVTTFFLFTFNQFSNSQIQNVTIIGLSYDVGDFSKGDLLLVTKKIDKVKKKPVPILTLRKEYGIVIKHRINFHSSV